MRSVCLWPSAVWLGLNSFLTGCAGGSCLLMSFICLRLPLPGVTFFHLGLYSLYEDLHFKAKGQFSSCKPCSGFVGFNSFRVSLELRLSCWAANLSQPEAPRRGRRGWSQSVFLWPPAVWLSFNYFFTGYTGSFCQLMFGFCSQACLLAPFRYKDSGFVVKGADPNFNSVGG